MQNGSAGDQVGIANTLVYIGRNYVAMDRFSEAEESFAEALGLYRELSEGQPSEDVADASQCLGVVYNNEKAYAKSEQCYTEALDIYRELSQNKDVAETLFDLGNNYGDMQELNKAEDSYKQAIGLYQTAELEHSCSAAMANTFLNLGNNQRDKQEFGEALACYENAIEAFREATGGEDNAEIGNVLSDIGWCYLQAGDDKMLNSNWPKG